MKTNLILVALSPEQIQHAKDVNGNRKQITHALICGPYGQLFGAKKQCLKYFEAWDPSNLQPIFPKLFDEAVEIDEYRITDYESTWDLVGIMMEVQDSIPTQRKKDSSQITQPRDWKKRSGFFKHFFTR